MVLFLLDQFLVKHGENELIKQYCFNGEFNGNGYKIYNLKIEQNLVAKDNETFFSVGFFSINYGIIENLLIENAITNVTISSSRFPAIGLLSGLNYGEIFNCSTTGNLYAVKTSSIADSNIGGLVGGNSGNIKCCYNTVNVNASFHDITNSPAESRVGGLAGVNESAGFIENSYNIGNITSKNLNDTEKTFSLYIGGLVGLISGEIKNSYSAGIVTSIDSNNLINYRIGSLVGLNHSSITNCYYLPNTVFPPRNDIQLTIGGEEKTTEYMKQNDFINDLNEGNQTDIWKINNNVNQGYPILYWQ